MATKDPVKYEGQQHLPFVPGDTLPPGIAPVITDSTIDGDGTTGNPLVVNPDALPPGTGGAAGPAGPAGPTGPTGASGLSGVTDTSSVDLLLASGILSGALRISADANNCLELRANGLFAACCDGATPPPPPTGATSIYIVTDTPNVTEGGTAIFKLILDAAHGSTISVDIAYSGTEEDAHPGQYPDETVVIPAGVIDHSFSRVTFGDAAVEPDRVLTATLVSSTPVLTYGATTANVNVLDNDAADPSGIINPATFMVNHACSFRSGNNTVSANSDLYFHPDGTWQLLRGPMGGGPSDGIWFNTVPTTPSDYEVRFIGTLNRVTTNDTTNPMCAESPVVETNTPVDTGWLNLGGIQQINTGAIASATNICTHENELATFTFTAELRQVSNNANTVTGSGSMCAEAEAMAPL